MVEDKGIALAPAVYALLSIRVYFCAPSISRSLNRQELDLSSALVFVTDGRLNLDTMEFTTPI
jgi:hypothetical protein